MPNGPKLLVPLISRHDELGISALSLSQFNIRVGHHTNARDQMPHCLTGILAPDALAPSLQLGDVALVVLVYRLKHVQVTRWAALAR